MTEEAPKVVNLQGQPVSPSGETPPEIIELLERALSAARSETYPAVAVAMVDENGAAVMPYFIRNGAKPLLGALDVLKYRIIKRDEEL